MMGLSAALFMLWLPPIPLEIPPPFVGTYATEEEACFNADAGMMLTLGKDALALYGMDAPILEIVELESEGLIVRHAPFKGKRLAKDAKEEEAMLTEPLPTKRPPEILVISFGVEGRVVVYQGKTEGPSAVPNSKISMIRCEDDNAPNH